MCCLLVMGVRLLVMRRLAHLRPRWAILIDLPDFRGVISADGARVYWTDLAAMCCTSMVRVAGVRARCVSVGAARYWTSAADGRYAFYTEGDHG